jgi:hypothetical protein
LPATFSRAPMPEASPAQQAAIGKALEGLGALGGHRAEAPRINSAARKRLQDKRASRLTGGFT